MNDGINNLETMAENPAEVLLRQLVHLKRFEVPETARMTRNKQNIMRQVREANANKRKSLGDLLELNIPWFFAEPKYGIAAVFVAFVGLQYAGMSAKNSSRSTGIYTSTGTVVAYEQDASLSTTNFSYPTFPDNMHLFSSPSEGDGSIQPAGFEFRR